MRLSQIIAAAALASAAIISGCSDQTRSAPGLVVTPTSAPLAAADGGPAAPCEHGADAPGGEHCGGVDRADTPQAELMNSGSAN